MGAMLGTSELRTNLPTFPSMPNTPPPHTHTRLQSILGQRVLAGGGGQREGSKKQADSSRGGSRKAGGTEHDQEADSSRTGTMASVSEQRKRQRRYGPMDIFE